nr:hypothetical protein [Cytophagales bacterium]
MHTLRSLLSLLFCLLYGLLAAQPMPRAVDPANPTDRPDFYKATLADIDAELRAMTKGTYRQIAESPGGLPLYAVYYGEKEEFHSQANYNSAVAALNPAFYARKDATTKPVIFFLGPVHGQESEGLVGLINLIHIAETGKDYRGRDWTQLQHFFDQFRVVIIPHGNPDGRRRSPYDTFVGLPEDVMTKYGQGTKLDGTPWRWPHAKALHPMVGDVDILGAYYNDNGINMMHDDFFDPMAEETKAILEVAKEEVPDMTVSLHSCSCTPFVIQNSHVPLFMKKRIADFAKGLNDSFIRKGLPNRGGNYSLSLADDDPEFPKASFNLVSALHHATGTMAFTFESPHGTIEDKATYENILDIQLTLY